MAEENGPQESGEQTDLSLTAIIKALDTGKPMSDARETSADTAFDPNATMNYQQAGMPYPELPFANEGSVAGTSARTREQDMLSSLQTSSNGLDEISGNGGVGTGNAGVQRTSVRNSPATNLRSAASANTTTRAARGSVSATDYENLSSNYRPLTAKQSTYKIRGGGHKQRLSPRSPVLIVASVILVVAGIGIFISLLNNVTNSASAGSSGYEFNLTTTQTREAIDARIPVLLNYVGASIEDTLASIAETGQYLYTNERYQPDSPDTGASGSETVSMPLEMSAEQMTGYYEGGYNAYTPEELAEYFNGSYTLDMARGELGSWNKVKYVNLNATSIEDEMAHLAEVQLLTGESVTVSAQGVDSRGNYVIQGQKVEGEQVFFFKIAACPFNEVYSAQALSDASVYITCTVANYDFFTGADTITAQ